MRTWDVIVEAGFQREIHIRLGWGGVALPRRRRRLVDIAVGIHKRKSIILRISEALETDYDE